MGLSSHAQQEPWAERWAQENAPTTLHEDNISSVAPNQAPAGGSQYSALAKSFGYFDDSNSNTMALLRSVRLWHCHTYVVLEANYACGS